MSFVLWLLTCDFLLVTFGLGIEIWGSVFESGIGIEQWDYNRWGVGIEITIDIEYWIDIDGCRFAGFMKN